MSPDIRVVKNWIKGNIEEIGCCQDVADHFGVKLEALSRRFVNCQGLTMLQYINQVKFERAKDLLRSGSLRCFEIVYRLKLGSPQYAARAFKRRFGNTMTEYCRKQASNSHC